MLLYNWLFPKIKQRCLYRKRERIMVINLRLKSAVRECRRGAKPSFNKPVHKLKPVLLKSKNRVLIHFQHIFREHNLEADSLSKKGIGCPEGILMIEEIKLGNIISTTKHRIFWIIYNMLKVFDINEQSCTVKGMLIEFSHKLSSICVEVALFYTVVFCKLNIYCLYSHSVDVSSLLIYTINSKEKLFSWWKRRGRKTE